MNENVKQMSNEDLVDELIQQTIFAHNLGNGSYEDAQLDLKFEILRRLGKESK